MFELQGGRSLTLCITLLVLSVILSIVMFCRFYPVISKLVHCLWCNIWSTLDEEEIIENLYVCIVTRLVRPMRLGEAM